MMRPAKKLRCSFCGRREAEVAKLVAGPKVYICDRCVALAQRLMNAADPGAPPASRGAPARASWAQRLSRWARRFGSRVLGRRHLRAAGHQPASAAVRGAVLLAVGLAASLPAAGSSWAGGQEPPGAIPPAVMQALKTRFPKAVIAQWTREEEPGGVIYDIEFRQDGRKFEADIRQDGTIVNWEREVGLPDLPRPVRRAIEARHPKAAIREVMQVMVVSGSKETVEGYEILLETAEKKTIEVTVAPDGTIREEARAGG